MLLSDGEIRAEIASGRLVIDPCDTNRIQPTSVDIHLGSEFLIFDGGGPAALDPVLDNSRHLGATQLSPDETFLLPPGEFALAATVETLRIPPDIAARLEGKSSLGRLGLLTHATAGFIDPGFEGTVTLELSSVAPLPIVLRPGMAIGQLCFMRLAVPVERPYGAPGLGSRYQGQQGPVASRAHLNADPAA